MGLAVEGGLAKFLQKNSHLLSKNWVVSYSGGKDSHVLLHALSLLRNTLDKPFSLRAVHINHQINPYADFWADHCQKIAKDLNVDCKVFKVDLNLQKGESLEAKARTARYDVIKQDLNSNDILLTAHTQDDQAETLLLQLLRGAGVQGLSAMGEVKALGASELYRPLLSITREEIDIACKTYNLTHIVDDSNDNLRFDRNYIRHEILPLLKTRFKGAVPSLARSASLCQEATFLQKEQSQADFQSIVGSELSKIKISMLKNLSFERQKAVVRYWINKNGHSYPSKSKLEDIIHQMNYARIDATPSIEWGNTIVRAYKANWYINSKQSSSQKNYEFSLEKAIGQGYRVESILDESKLTIKYRQGGERCKPAGQLFSKSLKKWFQIFNVPVWVRDSVPLVYYQEILIGAVGYFICEGWQVLDSKEPGLVVKLQT